MKTIYDFHYILHKTFTNLRLANLTDAILIGADMWGAHLSEANLTEANLTGADLGGAHMTYVDLSRAVLDYASLKEANLYCADLTDVSVFETIFLGANLEEATGDFISTDDDDDD